VTPASALDAPFRGKAISFLITGDGKETKMAILTRRSVLRASLGFAAAGVLARPHIANTAAMTAEVWWNQGFVPEEDAAFLALVADYEKASGNKIDQSLVPFAPMRQKAVSAIASGAVPDIVEVLDLWFAGLNVWDDKLVDVADVVETEESQFAPMALNCCNLYNSITKKRGYYIAPMKITGVPFHIWKSLVEKAGYKISDLPNTWDAFIDFFKPVQDKLRAQGMRNIYAYGYQLTANGGDPIATFNAFMIAYGGKDLVTPDGKLHTDDPKVREAAVKALVKLTTPYKDGYVPPGVVNWNDADDNNAFHSKLMVMDFDGTISTEVALYNKKEEYDDIVTHGLPLDNDGRELPAQVTTFGPMIPKGAKNIAVAKEFIKYAIQPKVLNEYLKAGLGRWMLPVPGIAKSDPFWLKEDPHRAAYCQQTLLGQTMPFYEVYNPAMAQVNAEHVFMVAEFDVMKEGMAPEAAVDKAFKRVEEIFSKYPIAQA
jgi:multiple sugar transport system substrate-binding protein